MTSPAPDPATNPLLRRLDIRVYAVRPDGTRYDLQPATTDPDQDPAEPECRVAFPGCRCATGDNTPPER